MTTATKVLNIARSQLGYHEQRVNKTKYGRWYGMNGVSWCDIFMSWVGAEADAAAIIGKAAYTPAHAEWFKKQGRFHSTPQRGDLVFYRFPGSPRIDHVGIVEKVRSDGRIQTIEGNTESGSGGNQSNGGGVYRRVRSRSLAAGYGRPAYGTEHHVSPMPSHHANTGRPPLIIDGDWGRNTTRALQRYLGVEDDGVIGPKTRRGLQLKLHQLPDGHWGKHTHRVLQRELHVADDGDWGPITVRALQRKLNGAWRK